MNQDDAKRLKSDQDGLLTYEYLANNIETCDDDLAALTDNLVRVDLNGQFTASAAKYLNAIDKDKYAAQISMLVAATIDKDREHRYLSDLMSSLYCPDCTARAKELSATDNNFRRIYKRLYPNPESL